MMTSVGTKEIGPICLIENETSSDGKLVVNEKALKMLAQIHQVVVVVSVVGLYRTGKSYLMNRLAGKMKGFALGSAVQALTKGIWMWCIPHPRRPDITLVLLDTEGLGDVGKGNLENDSWIFALAILLSSTLVYNSRGTIDQDALEKLHYVTELTKKIRTRSAAEDLLEDENSAEFVRFFPTFVWAVRDFTLELKMDGQPITDDEYLESALKLEHGDTEKIQKFNMPRLCIRNFFPSRKCFTFDIPTGRKNLPNLENMEDEKLAEDFVQPMERFCQHIWDTAPLKTIPGGQPVTGKMLATLVQTYVQDIKSGDLPCLENAVVILSEMENLAALKHALCKYEKLMKAQLALPMATLEELLELHTQSEKKAIRLFLARAFGENTKRFQTELQENIKQKKEEFCKMNEQASLDLCHAKLKDLSQQLAEGLEKNLYCVPGGYQCFLNKMREIEEKYHSIPGKGTQADKALEEFRKSNEMAANSILQMDKALAEKEKENEVRRAEAEAAQFQLKLKEQEHAKLEKMMENQKQNYDEQFQMLKDKMEEEKIRIHEETERVIQHKIKEREDLLKEGFEERARQMEKEIDDLKDQKNSTAMLFKKLLPVAIIVGKEIAQGLVAIAANAAAGEESRYAAASSYCQLASRPFGNNFQSLNDDSDSFTDDELD